jgi:hypothetical protein
MKLHLKICWITILFIAQNMGWAQNNIIKINGMVRDEDSNGKLAGASVTIYKNGGQFQNITVGENGKFKVELQLGNTYDIKFSLDQYAPKIARLETRNVPKEEQPGGYEFDMEVNLFKTPPNFNLDILKEPAAKAIYMSETDNIGWDEAYIIKQKDKIEAEFKRIAELNKADSQKRKEFDKIIQLGDEKVIKKSYEEAIAKYEQAQQMFPDDPKPKEKIAKVRELMAGDDAAKKEEAQYALLLVEGDEAMNNRRWEVAQAKFNEAKKMRPKDKVPTEKLAELEKRKKENAQFSQYDSLIREGDRLMTAEKYESCIAKYKEASNILTKENYPKEQIAKARELMEKAKMNAADIEKRNKKYQELISIGQKNMDKKDFSMALNNFEEAGTLKPDEELPKQKIEEIKRLMKEQEEALTAKKNLQEQEQANATKRKEYDRIIKDADKLLADSKNTDINKLNQAKAMYGQALNVLPAEAYPKAKSAEIDAFLDGLKQKMNAEQLAQQKAEEERLRKEAEWKKAQQEQEEKALADKRRREEEEAERKRKLNETLANVNSAPKSGGKAGSTAEDALDAFYREARRQRAQFKADSIADTKKYFIESDQVFTNKNENRKLQDTEEMNNQLDQLQTMHSEGDSWHDRRVAETEAEQAEFKSKDKDMAIEASKDRAERMEDVSDIKKAQASLKVNDQNRATLRNQLDKSKEDFKETDEASKSRSIARREANVRTFELQKEQSSNGVSFGNELQKRNAKNYQEYIGHYNENDQYLLEAANSRAQVARTEVESLKDNLGEFSEDRSDNRNNNLSALNDSRYQTQMTLSEKKTVASEKSFQKREELLASVPQSKQQTRSEIEKAVLSDEASITERSYDLGNKKVLERTVIAGGKTYVYKKLVSTAGAYYFKNGISITEQTWKNETTKLMVQE